MTLILHGTVYSTYTQTVLTTLAELGVDDYKLEFVDLFKMAHRNPDYLKLQPFGRVPVLVDGDISIFESRAIVRYLTEKYDGQALLGMTPKDRALVNQWWEVEAHNFNPPASTIVIQRVFMGKFGRTCDEKVVAEQVAKLEKVLDVYEAHLATNKYLAGENFTVADLSHLPYGNVLVKLAGQSELFSSRPHVQAWWTDISSRPSFQKVLALRKH